MRALNCIITFKGDFYLDYRIIKSKRKTIALEVNNNGEVIVRAPYFVSAKRIAGFVNSHTQWIEKKLAQQSLKVNKYDLPPERVIELKRRAQEYIPSRLRYYSDILGLYPDSLKITSAKKRYGSCSSKGNICFSLYLMLSPADAIDYVIVHELAHLKYMNHSKEFYQFIGKFMPDYKERKKRLI